MGAFKLGKMTFGSLFKKPETVKYPFESKPQPAGLKGHIAIDVDTCILCGLCERSCATNCIEVSKDKRTWSIDRLQCVQCGYCITVCPKKSLSMDPNYAPATTRHEADVIAIPESAGGSTQAANAAAKAEPAAKAEAASEPTPKPETPSTPASAEAPAAATTLDPQVQVLIGLMDDAAAEKVRAALS